MTSGATDFMQIQPTPVLSSPAGKPSVAPAGRKIKAVHLLHTIAYGGVEDIIINWFKHLQASPNPFMELSLVCFENPGHTEREFLDAVARAGIPVRTIPWSRRKPVFSSGRKLASILRNERADVLHTHNTYADLTGLVAAGLTGVKTISSVYVWSDFGWKRNLLQWINERALRHFDGVAAQCRTTMSDTCGRGIDPRKVRTVPSGFEVNRSCLSVPERIAQRRSHGVEETDVVLVNVARLYPEKAQAKMLRLMRQAVAVDPRLKLWILGVGPLEPELRALALELNLNGHVKFFGFCKDVQPVLKLADIQVHPSSAEGVPMAVIGGMACGLPVVASAVGGIPEILESGVAGLLVPSADHPDFENCFKTAILDLAEDQERRLAMGREAQKFIEEKYSMEAALGELQRFYQDVVTS